MFLIRIILFEMFTKIMKMSLTVDNIKNIFKSLTERKLVFVVIIII